MTLFRKHALLGLLNVSLTALLYSIFSDNDSKPKHNFLLKHEDISTDQNVSLQIETKSHLQWKRNPRCSFRVPSLNRKVPFTCGRGNFVSVVKSVCKVMKEKLWHFELTNIFVDPAWQPAVFLCSPVVLHGEARLPRLPRPGPDQGHWSRLQEGEVDHWTVQLLRLWLHAGGPALGQTPPTSQVRDQSQVRSVSRD